jgi:hypothetical protein
VGVVLPDGVLYNKTLAYVREFMRERFAIQAVISLPASAFAHYGTTVKASVVVMRRRAEGETISDDEPTFMPRRKESATTRPVARPRATCQRSPRSSVSSLMTPTPFLPDEIVEEQPA